MLKMNLQYFAKKKNALRGHFVADYDPVSTTPPADTDYSELAKWITDITDDTDETTDDTGDYSGDGTPATEVTAIAERWTFGGTWDAADEAQALIASKKRELGLTRKVWHKIVQTDGDTYVGVATVTGIKAGSGAATDFEEFACVLNYDSIPAKQTTP